MRGWDVIVVGGGGIGLAAARAIAESGRSVALLERENTGEGATRAAGGMLSPVTEAPGPGAFLRLGLDSLARWPAFAARLRDDSGVDVELRLDGKLLLALDGPEAERLNTRTAWLAGAGIEAHWLDGPELARREPGLRPAQGALLLAQEGNVDNRVLASALRTAAVRAGCVIREKAPVGALLTRSGRVGGVRTESGEELAADAVILAAGAWSGRLTGLPRALPVRPVKGQMLALEMREGTGIPRSVIGTEACYLIPREKGRRAVVWVGATSEEVGFTRGTTPEARATLRAAASVALPALAESVELEAWDGFRPGTPDGLPVLGPDPDLAGLVHATGHYRNGILLTPITAELVVQSLDGVPDPRIVSFGPARFSPS